ncbi:PepSY domain-containing protein [Pusillimonas sp.]|uniref:PepSY domain-containing protein n=1 Tax=Pusillimonas sp. TaxID=3040095 RepID=UPI0037C5D00C
MSLASRSKRLVYLTHRWTGIAGCLLMLIWFVSGIVMLYVGYPKLTPWERLAALPELDARGCCVWLHDAVGDPAGMPDAVVLTSIAGAPAYVVKAGGELRVYDGGTGQDKSAPVSAEEAMRAAARFAATQHTPNSDSTPEARASLKNDPSSERPLHALDITYHGLIDEDRWTHSGGLDAHRPLHKVDVHGAKAATLYVSSRTGQVVLDASVSQQRWNYVGAWLHWLYMFRSSSVDPVWTWVVIVLSFVGTVSAISGVCVGLWRWRFGGRYKSGSRSPYREPWMKWHHVAGLLFGGFVCTWIFSGLMSMNPEGVFSPKQRPNQSAYAGDRQIPAGPLGDPAMIITALNAEGFRPAELAWHSLGGRAYVLAHDRRARTRIVREQNGSLAVDQTWQPEQVIPAARRLFNAPTAREELVTEHGPYYYQRHPEAMNGALVRGLPALRVDFLDPDRTRVYIDLNTGLVASSVSSQARVGRWLFYFLHSWDTPGLLQAGAARDVVLILLSLGGIVVCIAGIVIGWRRLRRNTRTARTKRPGA